MLGRSSEVELSAVNGMVVGSTPTVSAKFYVSEWRNGSRAGLRSQYRKVWRFKSSLRHQTKEIYEANEDV